MLKAVDNPQHAWQLLFVAWLMATVGTLGALFMSEIMGLVPCELCWYQRICLFPLSVVLLMGLLPLDRGVVRYALPVTLIGLGFTVYHCLLFYGFIPESLQPCRQGISCKDDNMELFGWLPIPILSLIAFSAITLLLIKVRKIS